MLFHKEQTPRPGTAFWRYRGAVFAWQRSPWEAGPYDCPPDRENRRTGNVREEKLFRQVDVMGLLLFAKNEKILHLK